MRVERLRCHAISLLIILLLICVPCLGQTSGSLEVVVKDPSGALIHKAVVQLIRDGKVHSTAQTNQRGEVRFSKLDSGRYQLHVEAAGFKAYDVDQFDLTGPIRKEVSLEIEVIKVDVNVDEDPHGLSRFPSVSH